MLPWVFPRDSPCCYNYIHDCAGVFLRSCPPTFSCLKRNFCPTAIFIPYMLKNLVQNAFMKYPLHNKSSITCFSLIAIMLKLVCKIKKKNNTKLFQWTSFAHDQRKHYQELKISLSLGRNKASLTHLGLQPKAATEYDCDMVCML